MGMNDYGRLAQQHWERTRPNELATLEDPQRFFTELGEQVEQEIIRRALELETDPGTDEYVTNLGMMNEARATAEAEVLREMVFTQPGS
jgi:hypothetical protein